MGNLDSSEMSEHAWTCVTESSRNTAMSVRIRLEELEESTRILAAIRAEVEDAMKRTIPAMVEAVRLEVAHEFKSCIQIMEQEVMKNLGHNSSSRSLPHNMNSSASEHLRLSFVGTLPDTLLTWNNIQDEGALLEVELQDSSGSRVEVGPGASVKIEICVLDGDFEIEDIDDWTCQDFDKNVAKPRKDRGPLLKGKREIYLSKGVARVMDIAFTDNSKSMRNGKFRLGARVLKALPSGVEMRTAVSGPFKVMERRVKSYRKHNSPSLEDGTDCLKNIGKTLCQKLADKQIHTVKDFLQLYHTDANMLRNILQVSESKWSDLIKNAQLCSLSDDCYQYYDEASGVDLLLDCVFNVVRVNFNGRVIKPYKDLTDLQKKLVNEIRLAAFENKKELQKTHNPTIPASVQAECVATPLSSTQHLDVISAHTTAAMPCVSPGVNIMLEAQDLHGFTPNHTNQGVLPNQSSLGLAAGQELLSLMPSKPGMPVDQSQDSTPQDQSSITSPNSSFLDGAAEHMNEQFRLGCGNDTPLVRGANVPGGPIPDCNVELKRRRLNGCHSNCTS